MLKVALNCVSFISIYFCFKGKDIKVLKTMASVSKVTSMGIVLTKVYNQARMSPLSTILIAGLLPLDVPESCDLGFKARLAFIMILGLS